MSRHAQTPPMGWNSWDSYGTTVTEDEVLANADVLAERLLPHGWDTVVVDIDWYDPAARAHGYNDGSSLVLDAFGRQLPAPRTGSRRPPAARLRDRSPTRVHALGLRFGVHLMRGIPRLAVEQDLPVEGTAWTARDAADTDLGLRVEPGQLRARPRPPRRAGVPRRPGRAARRLGRRLPQGRRHARALPPGRDRGVGAGDRALAAGDIVLSLSPGTHLSTAHVDHLREHAQMWRISDDLWDRWEDVHAQFARLARWAPFQRPGGWADADMLPLGRIGLRAERGDDRHSRLTPDEQRTILTLWVMARSPLMVGGDLPTSDPATLDLLANPAVGHVLRTRDRRARGRPRAARRRRADRVDRGRGGHDATSPPSGPGRRRGRVSIPLASLVGHVAAGRHLDHPGPVGPRHHPRPAPDRVGTRGGTRPRGPVPRGALDRYSTHRPNQETS